MTSAIEDARVWIVGRKKIVARKIKTKSAVLNSLLPNAGVESAFASERLSHHVAAATAILPERVTLATVATAQGG